MPACLPPDFPRFTRRLGRASQKVGDRAYNDCPDHKQHEPDQNGYRDSCNGFTALAVLLRFGREIPCLAAKV